MKTHSASILRLSSASHTNCMSSGVTSALGVTNCPHRVFVQMLLLARCLLSTQGVRLNGRSREMSNVHAEYSFGCYDWLGVHYPHRVSVPMLDLARCQLSTQSILWDAMSAKVSTIYTENLRNFHSDATSGGVSTIHAEYPFER